MSGTDVLTRVHVDESAKSVTFERWQDVEDIVEVNKALRNERQKAETFHHIGCIPNVILERWMREDNVNYLALSNEDFGKLIKRKLRDPDWAHLRTTDRRF